MEFFKADTPTFYQSRVLAKKQKQILHKRTVSQPIELQMEKGLKLYKMVPPNSLLYSQKRLKSVTLVNKNSSNSKVTTNKIVYNNVLRKKHGRLNESNSSSLMSETEEKLVNLYNVSKKSNSNALKLQHLIQQNYV